MRRPNTPTKTSLQKEKHTLAFMNLINNILFNKDQSQMFQVSNFNSEKPNKSKILFKKDQRSQIRQPLSSNKTGGLQKQKWDSEFFTAQKNIQRKVLRPKSSMISGHSQRNASDQTHLLSSTNLVQNSTSKSVVLSKETNRNYHSRSQSKQLKIVQIESNLTKILNKCPNSIFSNKSLGHICGYGVNSHKFCYSPEVSQGRALIISNLTKTQKQEYITSLYSIFQTDKSVQYMDFVREHIQSELSKKLDGHPLPRITKEIIQGCLHRVEVKFCQKSAITLQKYMPHSMSITNSFGLSFAMVFVRNTQIIICTKGKTQVKMSSGYGDRIIGQNSHSLVLTILSINEIKLLDFIAIISQGINKRSLSISGEEEVTYSKRRCSSAFNLLEAQPQHKHNQGWLQRQLWRIMLHLITSSKSLPQNQLQQPNLTIHKLMGTTIDSLYSSLQKYPNFKNISIILLAFKNIQQMLLEEDILQLPNIKPNEIYKEIMESQSNGI